MAAFAASVAAGTAMAQVPDVRVKLDTTISYVAREGGPSALRLYDCLGRTSTLGFTFYLESGLRAYAAERLQRIPGDGDHDPMDEYYIEDEGIWRLGKQYLPFGSGTILKENVIAARGDTNLVVEGLPMAAAICDNGVDRQRGVVARIGRRALGISAAIGSHFGIASTALDLVRRPEDSPGPGHGWKQAFGADAFRRSGIFTTRAEFVALRDGATTSDRLTNIADISFTSTPNRYHAVTIGLTRRRPGWGDFYRIQAEVYVVHGVTFEPMVRYFSGKFYDASLAARVRF